MNPACHGWFLRRFCWWLAWFSRRTRAAMFTVTVRISPFAVAIKSVSCHPARLSSSLTKCDRRWRQGCLPPNSVIRATTNARRFMPIQGYASRLPAKRVCERNLRPCQDVALVRCLRNTDDKRHGVDSGVLDRGDSNSALWSGTPTRTSHFGAIAISLAAFDAWAISSRPTGIVGNESHVMALQLASRASSQSVGLVHISRVLRRHVSHE